MNNDNIISNEEFLKTEIDKLISKFKIQSDVMNGKAFAFSSTVYPRNWSEAITTTGYCVKVSEVFLNRMLKNYNYSKDNKYNLFQDAELICINLDSNLFGQCGDGSHNAWHTAISFNNNQYVIDLTCSQFSSQFINKYFWKQDEWLDTFENKNKNFEHDITFPNSLSKYMKNKFYK